MRAVRFGGEQAKGGRKLPSEKAPPATYESGKLRINGACDHEDEGVEDKCGASGGEGANLRDDLSASRSASASPCRWCAR